jgi:predicted O-methyltransferase YrrM
MAEKNAIWTDVDEYFSALFVPQDEALLAALASSVEAGLPPINVAPNQGKFLQLLVRISGAQRILEIGTLGGYSTIWMARALPARGTLITLELDPTHANVARQNFKHAGVDDIVQLREGAALDSLRQLVNEKVTPFDFIFIDADKANIPEYFALSLQLSRIGTTIVVDNVVRDGEVANSASTDINVIGVREFSEMAAREHRVSVTALQTVGSKGYDGFALMRVES